MKNPSIKSHFDTNLQSNVKFILLRLVEVLEHFTESPQLEKSLDMEDCPSP